MDNTVVLHLVISPWDLTDDYNRHAGALLISFLENCSVPVNIHLLYDEALSIGKQNVENINKIYFERIAERYNSHVHFHHVELPSWIHTIPAVKQWTPGTLMRLCLPEILPNVDKVIYLDCDMVVNTDMNVLWNLNVDDFPLAAVPDASISLFRHKRKKYYKQINIPYTDYFCAGTLIFNLKWMREFYPTFVSDAFSFLKEHPDLPFLDQDILNFYFGTRYLKLDSKYNLFSSEEDALDRAKDAIIHYASSGKPWKRYIGPIDDYYWKHLIETPWCGSKQDALNYARKSPDIDLCFSALPDNMVIYSKGRVKLTLKRFVTMNMNIIKEGIRGIYYYLHIVVLRRRY